MPEVRTTDLRFNLGKESQRKAWQYLQTMDKSVFKSYSQAVATAVVDYFDLYYQTQDDPYLETRACEEQFVQQIVDVSCHFAVEVGDGHLHQFDKEVRYEGDVDACAQMQQYPTPYKIYGAAAERQHQLGFCGWLIWLCGLYRNVWTSLCPNAHSSRMNTPMLSVGLPTVNAATPHEGRGRCCSEKRESSR